MNRERQRVVRETESAPNYRPVAQLSEVTAVGSADTFERPTYAGNAIALVESRDFVKAITAQAFDPVAEERGSAWWKRSRLQPAMQPECAETKPPEGHVIRGRKIGMTSYPRPRSS